MNAAVLEVLGTTLTGASMSWHLAGASRGGTSKYTTSCSSPQLIKEIKMQCKIVRNMLAYHLSPVRCQSRCAWQPFGPTRMLKNPQKDDRYPFDMDGSIPNRGVEPRATAGFDREIMRGGYVTDTPVRIRFVSGSCLFKYFTLEPKNVF